VSRDEILRLLSHHRGDIERFGVKSLALFGSSARGEAGERSDVDLLVEFAEPVGLFKFLDLKEYLENLLRCEVDLATPDALKRQLRATILAEAVHAF
jgi:hypothetical protein